MSGSRGEVVKCMVGIQCSKMLRKIRLSRVNAQRSRWCGGPQVKQMWQIRIHEKKYEEENIYIKAIQTICGLILKHACCVAASNTFQIFPFKSGFFFFFSSHHQKSRAPKRNRKPYFQQKRKYRSGAQKIPPAQRKTAHTPRHEKRNQKIKFGA